MPPRRRRTGYRPGELSAQLREAINSEAEILAGVEEHAATIDAVSEAIAAIDEHLTVVRQLRWDAVVALRAQGWSYDRIAASTSLSKSRVRQLAAEARARADGDAPAE